MGALADPLRLATVGVLANGEHCVCDLRDRVPIAANLLSYHLRVLRGAELVSATRRGRWVYYRLNAAGFIALRRELAAVGLPLPGQAVMTGRGGPEVPQLPCGARGSRPCGRDSMNGRQGRYRDETDRTNAQ
ncbi:MAG: ArsR/SmtB family transcription factor [Candidatus Dormibacteria bacterium]